MNDKPQETFLSKKTIRNLIHVAYTLGEKARLFFFLKNLEHKNSIGPFPYPLTFTHIFYSPCRDPEKH